MAMAAGSPCVGRACARDRAVLPEPAMAERLPPRGCFTRFVGNACQTVRAGAAGPASSRLRLVCTYARVRGVGRDGCVFAKNPAVLQKLLPKIAKLPHE